jgi:hypothetical protein
VTEHSPTKLQREALLLLTEAVRRTAHEERELLASRDAATREADLRLESIRRGTRQRLEEVRAVAVATWERTHARTEEEAAARLEALEREWKGTVESAEEKAVSRRSDAEKARQEVVWLAEAVYEATSNQPQEMVEQVRKGLKGYTTELDRIDADAAAWMAACRQRPAAAPPEVVDGPGEDELAAAAAAQSLPSKPGLEHAADEARQLLIEMRKMLIPRLFRGGLPIVLLLLPALAAGALAIWRLGSPLEAQSTSLLPVLAATVAGGVIAAAAMAGLYVMARGRLGSQHQSLLGAIAAGRRAILRCDQEAAALRDQQLCELTRRRDEDVNRAESAHGPLLAKIEQRRAERVAEASEGFPRMIAVARQERVERLAQADAARATALADAERSAAAALEAAVQEHEHSTAGARGEFGAAWRALVERWRSETSRCYEELEAVRSTVARSFPAWSDPLWESWQPVRAFPSAIPFGTLTIDLAALEGGLPGDPQLALPGPALFELPALLDFPEQASLLIESVGAGLEEAIPAVQALMFRLLTGTPAGKVRFTIIDPVGLGQNFAGFMHLADDDGALVTDRIWTEDRHIDQRLLDITEHMENVIQKYLRNEYQTIGRYNLDAGEIAEPYRFLVVANLPVNFSEAAARRLNSVVASGPRCGVFTLVTADVRAPRPPGLRLDDLARSSTALRHPRQQPAAAPPSEASGKPSGKSPAVRRSPAAAQLPPPMPPAQAATRQVVGAPEGAPFVLDDPVYAQWSLRLDAGPPEALLTRILRIVGKEARGASRVEVPFEIIAPPGVRDAVGVDDPSSVRAGEVLWRADATDALRVGLGRAGATKVQQLLLGQGVSQHVLIAGKTGSGKSTLLHALITNTAMWFGPSEVEFYLIDFKKGVEFKTYATHDLPQARVVAIESDREFGLSVLQRLDAELRRRGELYRELGVQDLAGHRRATAARRGGVSEGAGNGRSAVPESLPRTLLVIDEFQEFFTEDDKIAQDATLLLDRLVRQGRAFGIHVILGSQTLGGAYSLARATIGQMAVRIALQCSESDSYLILSDDNAAARLLARPGEAIYNDQGGLIEGNNPFQIAWLGEELRDRYLGGIRRLAASRGLRRREPLIVFEGNVPAELPRNALLAALVDRAAEGPDLSAVDARAGAAPAAWLGEAIAIKDPTAAHFRRQSGANLLVVGQRDDSAVGLLFSGALGLVAQRPDAKVLIFDALPPDSPEAGKLGRLAELLPGAVRSIDWREVAEAIGEVHGEFERRQQGESGAGHPIFLVFAGLHRYRALRQEDDFGFTAADPDAPPRPEKQFASLLREGPVHGIHTLAWIDTANNLNRTLDRQGMREFEQRVLFQMGQSDSSTLMDSPAASKLGLHRAIYFSEESGVAEKFRPYEAPPEEWLERVAAVLRGRAAAAPR